VASVAAVLLTPTQTVIAQEPATVAPIVVVGGRTPTSIGGASALIISPDSLPLPSASPLDRLLREIPFLLVRQNSRGESEISVRGSDSRQAAVMLDGLPLTLGWDHRSDPSLIPVTGIEEVTVVRGLSSVLGGPNVLGGSIEFGLARPMRRATAHLSSGIDGVGAYGVNASGGAPISTSAGQLTVRGGVGYRNRTGLALSRDGASGDGTIGGGGDPGQDDKGKLRTNSDVTELNGFAALRLDGSRGRFASFTASAYDAERGVPAELHVTSPRLWRYPTLSRMLAIASAGTGDVATPLGTGRLEASLGTNRSDLEIEAFTNRTLSTVASRESGAERTNTLRLNASHSLGEHAELRAVFTSAAVEYDETINTDPTSFYRQELQSLGAEINWPLTAATQVSAGVVRDAAETPLSGGKPPLDRISKIGWRFGATQLAFSETVRLHASVSQRSRFPALRELYSGALNRFEPNPDLRPETLLGMEIGATLLGGAANAGVMLQVVAFRHELDDAVIRIAVPDRKFKRVNRDVIHSAGLELLLGWTALPGRNAGFPVGMRVSGDLTVQRIRVTDQLLAAGLPNERRAEHNPEIRGAVEMSMPLPAMLRANAALRVTGAQYCVHPDLGYQVRLGAQSIGDVGVSRTVTGRGIFRAMRALFSVDNVTDATVYDQCGLPQAGRTVRVGLELR
jgi:iron complex outermembrane receptor protein